MQVSGRARLAWANRNLEAAADIIVADYLRALSEDSVEDDLHWGFEDLSMLADELDPAGEN